VLLLAGASLLSACRPAPEHGAASNPSATTSGLSTSPALSALPAPTPPAASPSAEATPEASRRAALEHARARGRAEGQAAVVHYLTEIAGIDGLDTAVAALDGWARVAPEAALAFVVALDDMPGQDYLLYALAPALVATDPAPSFTRVASLPEGHRRDTLLLHLTLAWLDHDAPAALGHLAAQAATAAYVPAIEQATRHLARESLAPALDWAAQVPDSRVRESSWDVLADWTTDLPEPERAAWFAQARLHPNHEGAYHHIATRLAAAHPELARLWAAAIANPDLRQLALLEIERAKP
jgi:hypothetical protein